MKGRPAFHGELRGGATFEIVSRLGATPGEISKLKAGDLRVVNGLLRVRIRKGIGDYAWTPAPETLKAAWQGHRACTSSPGSAVPRRRQYKPDEALTDFERRAAARPS